MTLTNLKKNEYGIILSVSGNDEIASRLGALGFVKDKLIKVSNDFFGDPIIVQLGDQSFVLRKSEAESISVKKYCGVK